MHKHNRAPSEAPVYNYEFISNSALRKQAAVAKVDLRRPPSVALSRESHLRNPNPEKAMKQVLIKAGNAFVDDVPAPTAGSKNILVRVAFSCISVGTEMAGVRLSGMPLYQRALKQPENVKRVVDMARAEGLRRTFDRVTGKLAAGSATGYSASGFVVSVGREVTGFAVGDRVACAGAGIANHAELIDVPENLAVKLPDAVTLEDAATVTLGAIALQGVRRAQPTLGETFVVIGLGILGQLTCQFLQANGCRVIGVDIDARRIALAVENGMHVGLDPSADDYVERVINLTGGIGADAAIITAASESDQIISDAMRSCRKKGRVVLVGDVGLHLNRADFYKKELDFLISSSYGPGRYDPAYEEGGQDYPIGYVRWTENRNMHAYLQLLGERRVSLTNMSSAPYAISEAANAYEALKGEGARPLLVLLHYPESNTAMVRRVAVSQRRASTGAIRVALAGAGGFAQGMHLPNMLKLRDRYQLRAVMSRTGANAKAVATQYEAAYATTDYAEVLADPEIDLVIIATRHNLHGSMVLDALRSGKHVFVEKPLAVTAAELDAVEQFYEQSPDVPILMTGFNRRFSPGVCEARKILKARTTPVIINYRMNAGYIPLDHWVHGPEGGGRNIGEACHIYDVFQAFTGSRVRAVHAAALNPSSPQWARNDNFVATISYSDGSVCTLTYTALGDKNYPKERMEIFADGKVIALDDYKALHVHGGKHKGWSSQAPQKGQFQELEALAGAISGGDPWPISLEEQLQTSRLSLEIERQIFSASATALEGS
jgi:predicted dehydrogenase/threonine dehydrogenase-like Zn-dependent dehydrogenase